MSDARSAPALASALSLYQHRLRVYWEDTDAGGVVFYANYLKFFERARTEWLRHLGVGQQTLRDQTGAIFVVTDSHVHYRAAARLDDELQVSVALRQRGTASMVIHQQAWRRDTLVAEAEIRIGCVDQQSFRPRRIPHEVIAALAVHTASPTPSTSLMSTLPTVPNLPTPPASPQQPSPTAP